jgi:hypothetical protein
MVGGPTFISIGIEFSLLDNKTDDVHRSL